MITVATVRTPWIAKPRPNPAARLRLLCFPHAGAGASAFAAWPSRLPPDVEVCAVQMPGREVRLNEPPVTRWDDALDQLSEALQPQLDRPFALFGHSLGALLAFEFIRRLRRDRRPGPVHLFVSGRRAPHLASDDPLTPTLSDEAFVTELRRLTGTPEDLLNSPEMLAIFLPLLRADLALAQAYAYREDVPLSMPISAYGGIDDEDVPVVKLQAWRRHTTSTFRHQIFPGGHFYLHDHRAAVLAELSHALRAILVSPPLQLASLQA
jgi:medium-chain acyl-[acyl-carrier-protein] hydrolase